MRFKTETDNPVIIGVGVDGKEAGENRSFPTDLAVRQAFYEIYEDLKAYKPAEITSVTDENGVSNVDIEKRELKRFTGFLAERFDRVFGEGAAAMVTGGKCNPTPLVRFICETAQHFRAATEKLVSEYIAPDESGVME